MPTSALRASLQEVLQLLDTRPPVDAQAWATSRRRLGVIMSQRAVEEDWIAWPQARRRHLGSFGDTEASRALHADIRVHVQRRRLIDRERHAGRMLEEHERGWQAFCDWQLDHVPQLVQAQWHAQAVPERQERVLDEVVAAPPPYLLAELRLPPERPEGREVWRQGAQAILRYRKHFGIQDSDLAFGQPRVGASLGLRRGQVEVIVDLVRQLIHQPRWPFPLNEGLNAPDLGAP
jgi:hypothetical protein